MAVTQVRGNKQIKAASITETELNTSVAGEAIVGGAGTPLALKISELSPTATVSVMDRFVYQDVTDNSNRTIRLDNLINDRFQGNGLRFTGAELAAFVDGTSVNFNGLSQIQVKPGGITGTHYAASFVVRETPAGTINGINTIFTLANTPIAGKEQVYLNGVLQDEGGSDDYTISSATITFNTAPLTGDSLRVTYIK